MSKADQLKRIAVLCTDVTDIADVEGETIEEVLDFIASNFVLEKPE